MLGAHFNSGFNQLFRQGFKPGLKLVGFCEYQPISVVVQWIRPLTLNSEVPLGKALYPHCLVPWKGLKTVGPPGRFLISILHS